MQGWHVENLETIGGNPYGVLISGDLAGTLRHFRLTNLDVHDVGGVAQGKESGLVIVTPKNRLTLFDDVVIDGVTAYGTQQWSGILIGGDDYESLGYAATGAHTNITVRNSAVYDTYGDGIVLYHVTDGMLEYNVVHDVGNIPTTNIGTPNAIWTWWCTRCTVQFNEGYNVHSPGIDGGVFDIDYWNTDNVVQYNYGHDADGYCIAVFGAGGRATTNSIVRYNVCANNGRQADGAKQGDFYLATWNGGSIDGLQVYNNTFYWNPVVNEPAVVNRGTALSGSAARFFKNNLVVTTVDKLVWSETNLALDNNLYWYTAGLNPWWGYGNGWWDTLAGYSAGSGQDARGVYANPLLNDPTSHGIGKPTTQFTLQSASPALNKGADVGGMGSQDFYGNAIPNGAYDIGAHESVGTVAVNLLNNPGFESDLTGWTQWWDSGVNASSVAYISSQGAHTGAKRLTHWANPAAFKQYTAQTSSNLIAGTYTLKVWVQTNGGLTKISFGGKNCNGTGTQEALIPTTPNLAWTDYSTSITVTGSTCEVNVWSESTGGAERYTNFDNLGFTRN